MLYMANKGGGLPGGSMGVMALIALVVGGGFLFMKMKNGGGGMSGPPSGAMLARKPGGCGCGK